MWHVPFFRIFYSTSFTILLLITLALLAVSPIDIGYHSYQQDKRWTIVIVSGVYVLVALVTLFIYATRLYTTRTHLAAIPKSRLPLEKGDLPKRVRRLVLQGIEQSAGVAFKARPRDLTGEDWESTEVNANRRDLDAEPVPTWGMVSHPGCSAPNDPDMPNLHYEPVLKELPHLLEARAVSLAPTVQTYQKPDDDVFDEDHFDAPDSSAVAILQRAPAQPFRAYIAHLADLGVFDSIPQATVLVQRYEEARFGSEPLNQTDFRTLMDSFALILDGMQEPDPEVLAAMLENEAAVSMFSGPDSNKSVRRRGLQSEISSSIRQQRSMASMASEFDNNSVVRTRVGPRTAESLNASNSSLDVSENFATPGQTPGQEIETPFYTPYPTAASIKTASTGSLAGSEGTVETARSRVARTDRSGKRTPSAFSRRSRRSGRSRSRGGFGLGLKMTERGERGQEQALDDVARRGSESGAGRTRDLEKSQASEEMQAKHQHNDSDQGSVRRRSIKNDSASIGSADSVIIRKDKRLSQPENFPDFV